MSGESADRSTSCARGEPTRGLAVATSPTRRGCLGRYHRQYQRNHQNAILPGTKNVLWRDPGCGVWLKRTVAVDSHVTGTCFPGEKCATTAVKSATQKPGAPEHERYSSRHSKGRCGNTTANSGSKRGEFATCGGRAPRQDSRRPCPKRATQYYQEQRTHERHQTSQ